MNKIKVLFSLMIMIGLTGCGQPAADIPANTIEPGGTNTTNQASPAVSPKGQTLTVFAAASLTSAFQDIARVFESSNPNVTIEFNFTGSQILRVQLEQGAKADIFAPADHMNMDALVAEGLVAGNGYPDFATNKLVVILPPGDPAGIPTLADLAKPGLKIVLADPSVPAGNYARQVLANLSKDPAYGADFNRKVLLNLVSNETDVKQVVTKVELGEADAGIVYVSDVVAAPGLLTIAIPDEFNVTARYPIAVLKDSAEPKLAQDFVDFITSPAGQAIMLKWGFNPPSK